MLKGLTSTFKDDCNNVELTYKEYVKLDNDIIPVKATLKDDVYENGNFIGTFILKEIQFETEATYEFRNKEFEYYKEVDGESIKIGTFISTDITINDTTEIVKVVGMDYGLKTQVEYTSALDYASGTITLKDVWDECCELSGLESGIEDFANSDFIVDSDQFTGTGAMIRDVFKGIAMSCGSFVKVMNDDKVYLIFNEITSEKEELEIDGSASVDDVLKIDELTELDGNTTQEGTPTPDSPQPVNVVSGRQEVDIVGKNLFNPATFIEKNNIYCSNEGVLTSDGFSYATWNYSNRNIEMNLEQGTYSFSLNFSQVGTNSNLLSMRIFNSSGSQLGEIRRTNNIGTYTTTITLTSTTTIGIMFKLETKDIATYQIEKGQPTPYEEYKGQSYEINLGKNLANINNIQIGKSWSGTANNNRATILLIPIIEGQTYSLVNSYTNENITQIRGVLNKGSSDQLSNLVVNGTFTVYSGWTHISIEILANTTFTSEMLEDVKIMLCKGTATIEDYAPYKTPIELCKIGDYKDRIYKDNNKWYIEKQIGKVVLDGSEYWGKRNDGDGSTTITFQINGAFGSFGANSEYCNRFVYEQSSSSGNEGIGIGSEKNTAYIQIKRSRLSSLDVAGFTSWLSINNTTVYYVLATPTTTEITDSELISQLESIELLEGLNNISITSSDLTGKLKLSYYNNELDIIEDYVELEDKRDTHPWTCLRLGMSNVEGENVDYIDEDLVQQYGENWLILNDNPFAYNQEKKQQLIVAIFNQIKEFGYSAFVSKVAFKPYLTCGDVIRFKNRDKELVNSIVLRYTHNAEEIQIEAPSETSATVNYKYPLNAIDIAKQTQIVVDKDSVRIDSLTSQTQTIQDDLRQNYYTSIQTNELIQTASTGLTNTFSEAGGNNIFRNTGLWFATNDNDNPYEFWNGVVAKQKEEKASNMSAMLLQNGNIFQEQLVPNGTYTISFKYKKLIFASTISVSINDILYELNETEETTFNQTIEVSSQHINIKFTTNVNNSGEIYDLMVNAGAVSLAYSQNQNETTTDTVNISKGIEITSSDTEVRFKANADGIRTLDRSGNELTKFTDTGMKTKEAIIEDKAQIVGTLWQEVNGQTWITRL